MIFSFLGGKYLNEAQIYGIKTNESWFFFDEQDTSINKHSTFIQKRLKSKIINSNSSKVSKFKLNLEPSEYENYLIDNKFIFNGRELKKSMQISSSTVNESIVKNKREQNIDDLLFIEGTSNPIKFLDEFERISNQSLFTDKERCIQILKFVNEADKKDFAKFHSKNCASWSSVRQEFIKRYTNKYTINKRLALSFRFEEATSLRSFVERKLDAMSTYTAINDAATQLDLILAELPDHISNLFVQEDKLSSSKNEILELCDFIQIETEIVNGNSQNEQSPVDQSVIEGLEIFNNDVLEEEANLEGRRTLPKSVPKKRIRSESSINDLVAFNNGQTDFKQTLEISDQIQRTRSRKKRSNLGNNL